MKKILPVILTLFLFLSLSGIVNASTLGQEITIFDKNKSSVDWYGEGEDQEVEPGMVRNQNWDMEGFFLNGAILSMVGGYNFETGYKNTLAGDIFIDINDDAVFGDIHGNQDGNFTVDNTFGYDYVLDMDFSTSTYDVYKIDENSQVETSYYKQNQGSNPWRWVSVGIQISSSNSFGYNIASLREAASSIFVGGNHNVVSGLNLSFLEDDLYGAIFHSTMQCGNDNLMGQAPVPEPATIVLFGIGLLGLARIGRKSN